MLKISHGTRINDIDDTNGYGYATVKMIESLTELGYQVATNDPTADVEIWFDQPHHWKFSPGTYKIGYHPWESTKLLKDWAEKMNECDEIWTPSPVIAEWYTKYSGIKVPVYVYEHGVDDFWEYRPRVVEDRFKFLHIGGEAARKGWQDASKALKLAFPNNTDVELNLKIISKGWNIGRIGRVNIHNERTSIEVLRDKFFYDNHVYVYPSYGEGFGLTPLQAMATGMPTITLPGWAPYKEFLNENLSVSSGFAPSPWPALHPGKMLKPDLDSLVEAMRYAYFNYDEVTRDAHEKISGIRAKYNWSRLTKEAFESLENRLKTLAP